MTAINYARNLAGSDVGSAHFNHPRYEVRSARWHIVRPVLLVTPFPPFGGGVAVV